MFRFQNISSILWRNFSSFYFWSSVSLFFLLILQQFIQHGRFIPLRSMQLQKHYRIYPGGKWSNHLHHHKYTRPFLVNAIFFLSGDILGMWASVYVYWNYILNFNFYLIYILFAFLGNSVEYRGTYQTSMMELFAKKIKDFESLTIFLKTFHHKWLTGSWIHLWNFRKISEHFFLAKVFMGYV